MTVPTLYEWIGGFEALKRLTEEFYRRVPQDDLLGPVFAGMDKGHPEHVAMFLPKCSAVQNSIPNSAAAIRKWSGTISASI